MNNMKKLEKNPITPFLIKFCEALSKAQEVYFKRNGFDFNNPSKILVHNIGAKYIRLGVFEERPYFSGKLECSSVYCFVDATNGNVLKGSWKAPVANGIRGNLKDKDILKKVGVHGPLYLTGGKSESVADMLATA